MYAYVIRMSLVYTHPYVTRMYSYVIRMSHACTRMSSVCFLYVHACHLYITRICSNVILMSLVCTRMSPVCPRIYSYVIRMSFVCTRMSSVYHSYVLVCHPYATRMYSHVTLMWFYHKPLLLSLIHRGEKRHISY